MTGSHLKKKLALHMSVNSKDPEKLGALPMPTVAACKVSGKMFRAQAASKCFYNLTFFPPGSASSSPEAEREVNSSILKRSAHLINANELARAPP